MCTTTPPTSVSYIFFVHHLMRTLRAAAVSTYLVSSDILQNIFFSVILQAHTSYRAYLFLLTYTYYRYPKHTVHAEGPNKLGVFKMLYYVNIYLRLNALSVKSRNISNGFDLSIFQNTKSRFKCTTSYVVCSNKNCIIQYTYVFCINYIIYEHMFYRLSSSKCFES